MEQEPKTITRIDLTEAVYRELGFSHSECSDLVDSVLDEISKSLEGGDAVKLSSFGSFKVRHKKQRVGRNPKTKVEVPITARTVVTFHASNIMNQKINDALTTSGNEPSDFSASDFTE